MDRRSFLRTSSLIAAAASLAPKKLLDAAFAYDPTQAYPVTSPCPSSFGAAVVPAAPAEIPAVAFLRNLLDAGYKPAEIAYVPETNDTPQVVQTLFGPDPDEWPPYFMRLHAICYRMFVKGSSYKIMDSNDLVAYLKTQPDYHAALANVDQDEYERLACSSLREVWELPLDQNRAYRNYRRDNLLLDYTDILEMALWRDQPIEGVKVAVFTGDNPPLWDATAKCLFRKAEKLIFLRRDA